MAQILNWIRDTYPYPDFEVSADVPNALGSVAPHRVGGKIPDVYAYSAARGVSVIGEAKTEKDLMRDHTEDQLIEYVKHLSSFSEGVLVLATDLRLQRTAKAKARRTIERAGASSLKLQVLGVMLSGFSEAKDVYQV